MAASAPATSYSSVDEIDSDIKQYIISKNDAKYRKIVNRLRKSFPSQSNLENNIYFKILNNIKSALRENTLNRSVLLGTDRLLKKTASTIDAALGGGGASAAAAAADAAAENSNTSIDSAEINRQNAADEAAEAAAEAAAARRFAEASPETVEAVNGAFVFAHTCFNRLNPIYAQFANFRNRVLGREEGVTYAAMPRFLPEYIRFEHVLVGESALRFINNLIGRLKERRAECNEYIETIKSKGFNRIFEQEVPRYADPRSLIQKDRSYVEMLAEMERFRTAIQAALEEVRARPSPAAQAAYEKVEKPWKESRALYSPYGAGVLEAASEARDQVTAAEKEFERIRDQLDEARAEQTAAYASYHAELHARATTQYNEDEFQIPPKPVMEGNDFMSSILAGARRSGLDAKVRGLETALERARQRYLHLTGQAPAPAAASASLPRRSGEFPGAGAAAAAAASPPPRRSPPVSRGGSGGSGGFAEYPGAAAPAAAASPSPYNGGYGWNSGAGAAAPTAAPANLPVIFKRKGDIFTATVEELERYSIPCNCELVELPPPEGGGGVPGKKFWKVVEKRGVGERIWGGICSAASSVAAGATRLLRRDASGNAAAAAGAGADAAAAPAQARPKRSASIERAKKDTKNNNSKKSRKTRKNRQ